MANLPSCILLSCGSFNPITIAHLRMFEIAKDYLHSHKIANVVRGIISPVHDGYGKKGLESATHRCNMIREALKSTDWITLDTWECQQDHWLETAKVLAHVQNTYNDLDTMNDCAPMKRQKLDTNLNDEDVVDKCISNNHNGNSIQVKLLCGADVLESFAVPGLWKESDIAYIVGEHGLVVVTRNDTNPLKFIHETDILAEYENNITIVTEWISTNISATEIRRALRRNRSVKYLVVDAVIDYIKKHSLYGIKSKTSV